MVRIEVELDDSVVPVEIPERVSKKEFLMLLQRVHGIEGFRLPILSDHAQEIERRVERVEAVAEELLHLLHGSVGRAEERLDVHAAELARHSAYDSSSHRVFQERLDRLEAVAHELLELLGSADDGPVEQGVDALGEVLLQERLERLERVAERLAQREEE